MCVCVCVHVYTDMYMCFLFIGTAPLSLLSSSFCQACKLLVAAALAVPTLVATMLNLCADQLCTAGLQVCVV